MVLSISQKKIKKIEIFPIIHIIGLPGAGKSTLSKKLTEKFELPVFYIGILREVRNLCFLGEDLALRARREGEEIVLRYFEPEQRSYRYSRPAQKCEFITLLSINAWVNLFRDLSKRKWKNCILETTGLNRRECFLRSAFPFGKFVIIKLNAKRKVLFERIKKKNEQGGEWLFSADYRDKYEFVNKLFKEFKNVPAEIDIDTSEFEKK